MLRINDHKMNLNQAVMGFVRHGKIECPSCGMAHIDEIRGEIKQREADPLYGDEARHQVCDCCGAELVVVEAV